VGYGEDQTQKLILALSSRIFMGLEACIGCEQSGWLFFSKNLLVKRV
jgi:hypothetical protein